MAMELAPVIRVDTVCPGVVNTDMDGAGFAVEYDEEAGVTRQPQRYLLKRVATAAGVSSAVLFLSNDGAQLLPVNFWRWMVVQRLESNRGSKSWLRE